MAESKKKVSIVVEAIDKVSAPVRVINSAIARIVAPARGASRAMQGLMAESGLKRVAVAAGNVGKQFGGVKSAIGSIVSVAGIATAALGGLFYALKRNADAGDEAVKAAQRFGLSIEDWQRLSYAADLAKVSTEELGGSLKYINKNAVAAATGNQKMALWFWRAGVNVKDMNGKMKPSRKLLEELADKFASMPDGAKKTALAVGLLGDSGERMIPFLNGGAKAMRAAGKEAEALGLVDAKLAQQQEEFNNNLTRLGRVSQGVFNAIASAVLPVINELVPSLVEWIKANRELIGTKMKEFMAGFKESLPAIVNGLKSTFNAIVTVASAVNSVVQFFGGWKTVLYAVAAFMASTLVLAIGAATLAVFSLGAAILTTPIGWIAAGIAALAAGAYLIIKHWQPIKDFFGDLIKNTFAPVLWIIEKIVGLLPQTWRAAGAAAGNRITTSVKDFVAPSAIPASGVGASVNGQVTVKVETAPGVRARVTDQQSSGPVDLGVETGYAMAGAH